MNRTIHQGAAAFPGQGVGLKGRLAQWDDAKGYGWVEAEGRRVFAHIKEFERGQRRPVAGDEVTFTAGADAQGRPRATAIRLVKNAAWTGGRIGLGAWVALAALLVLPWLAGLFLPGPDWGLFAGMGAMSVVTWFTYQGDKRSAATGAWRTSETTLHVLELLGGWPGAFLAQRRFRHKTRKAWFQFIFVGIVLLHQIAAVDVPSRWVWRELKSEK
jgi:uncharacterized membrane protein YsdA (DUF1294 family)/cold shock CspA family protein